MPEQYRSYTVERRVEEAPGVSTFFIRPVSGTRPAFAAGQFVTIALPGHAESKSYTIASAPAEADLAVTIRAAGTFSNQLLEYRPGETLLISEPLGYFCADSADTPRLWLAGGIGITPFMSMLRDTRAPRPQTVLYYSNRTVGDIVFKKELEQTAAADPRFEVRNFITREPEPPAECVQGRITGEHLREALKKLPRCQAYLCGSIGFVRDYWREMRRLGVPEDQLFTEAFF